jgi:CRP-like cAMP-binding protein
MGVNVMRASYAIPQLTRPRPSLRFAPLQPKAPLSHLGPVAERCQLFANLPHSHTLEVLSAAQVVNFDRQETVFRAGEMIQRVMLVTDGSVKVTLVDHNGCAVILRLVGPGEILGTIGGARSSSSYSSAEARENSKAYVWSVATFEALSERFPIFRRNSMGILATCLQDLEVRFREISTETVAFRLSREISRLIPRIGRMVDRGGIEINLSREELAQMTATTLFTVSRLLSKWEQVGIVSLGRLAVVVRDPIALENISACK